MHPSTSNRRDEEAGLEAAGTTHGEHPASRHSTRTVAGCICIVSAHTVASPSASMGKTRLLHILSSITSSFSSYLRGIVQTLAMNGCLVLVLVLVVLLHPKLTTSKLIDAWIHVLLLKSLDDLEGERERVKGVGSTRTNTNYHLLEVLVFGVLVQTNTKITPVHGSFVLVCPKLTLTHGSIHGPYLTPCAFLTFSLLSRAQNSNMLHLLLSQKLIITCSLLHCHRQNLRIYILFDSFTVHHTTSYHYLKNWYEMISWLRLIVYH
jgi:hypothetical protein